MEQMRVEGLNDVMQMFDGAPETLAKLIKRAANTASKKMANRIKGLSQSKVKTIVKGAVMRESDETTAYIGLFGTRKKNNNEIPEWFKEYWAAYGTLKHRDPAHHFDHPIKGEKTVAAQRRRNNEGQEPDDTRGLQVPYGWESTFMKDFNDAFDKAAKKLMK